MGDRLEQSWYQTEDTITAAKEMLGKLLVVPDANGERVSGMIVEAEAYCGITDRAAHSYGGRRTARNEVTYGPGGHAYVFFIYGMYFQFNVVLGRVDRPHVLLIRAVEPIEGVDLMRTRRGSMKDTNLTSGPGKLCIALGIERSYNGEDLVEGNRIWIEDHRSFTHDEIVVGKRIGIDYAGEDADLPWRFWIRENAYISRK